MWVWDGVRGAPSPLHVHHREEEYFFGAATFLIGFGAVITLIGGGLFAGATFTSTVGRIVRL